MRKRGTQAFSDTVNKIIAVAMLIGALMVFGVTAVYGVQFVDRLGGAGWLIYVILIGTFALVFGPVVASAHGFWERGSPRHRREVDRRKTEQAAKYRFSAGRDQAEDDPESPR